jgi:hypothetical protein
VLVELPRSIDIVRFGQQYDGTAMDDVLVGMQR